MASHILSKIHLVDMTEGVAGPYAATVLADMGANVIKVERPAGDWSRTAGKGDVAGLGSAQFLSLNRNKRDIGLDVSTPAGRAVVERLIARADVVLSNYRAGVMDKLGLSYERCRALRSEIVYCTVSGFGRTGPYAQRPASDTIMQAMSGVMSLVGEPDGPPLRVGFPLIDMAAANYAVQAILLALYGRREGHGGADIDVSLMAAAHGLMNSQVTGYLASGQMPMRQGNQNSTLAPAGAYRTADARFISIAILRDEHWRKLADALDLGALVDDPRFVTNADRVRNRSALDEVLIPIFAAVAAEDLLARLRKADILSGPINTVADAVADPALDGVLPMIAPGVEGVERVIGTPIRFNGSFFTADTPAPRKGEHTRAILSEIGYTGAQIAGLLADGTVFEAAPR